MATQASSLILLVLIEYSSAPNSSKRLGSFPRGDVETHQAVKLTHKAVSQFDLGRRFDLVMTTVVFMPVFVHWNPAIWTSKNSMCSVCKMYIVPDSGRCQSPRTHDDRRVSTSRRDSARSECRPAGARCGCESWASVPQVLSSTGWRRSVSLLPKRYVTLRAASRRNAEGLNRIAITRHP